MPFILPNGSQTNLPYHLLSPAAASMFSPWTFTFIFAYFQMERMPLHIAAECGHTSLVDFLITHCKATLTERTRDGSTLIHIASKYGHPETALAFLKKGVPLLMPNKVSQHVFCIVHRMMTLDNHIKLVMNMIYKLWISFCLEETYLEIHGWRKRSKVLTFYMLSTWKIINS